MGETSRVTKRRLQRFFENGLKRIRNNQADEYSETKTYAVGDYCIYNNTLYKCTKAVSTAGPFTASSWKQTTVASEIDSLYTNLAALQELRFFSITPYFNVGHTTSQAITANGNTYIFFPDINNAIFEVANSGDGQYFTLKKVGSYRFTLHVTLSNITDGLLTLDLKNSGNTTTYKTACGHPKYPLDIVYYNATANTSFLLNLISDTAGTLYSDTRYTWIEVEYMG